MGKRSAVRDQKSEASDQPIDQKSDPGPQTYHEALEAISEESLPALAPETTDEKPESGSVEAAIKDAFSSEGADGDAAQPPPAAVSKRVEVLFNGRLGPKLLTRGDVTDDPAYVALLGDRRGLVRAVE